MNVLVRKEIRLLLPMWIAAMLLALLPNLLNVVLGAGVAADQIAPVGIFVTGISGLLLGLTSFGREIYTHTFSLLLAQPRRRTDLWRTKIKVLLVAVGLLYLFLVLVNQNFIPADDRGAATALLGLAFVVAAVSGGLWTTLLLRQVIAAFWVSLLIPFVVVVTVFSLNEEVVHPVQQILMLTVILLIYSVVSYWFARWQFLHAQDAAWTDGILALPQMTRRRSENRAAGAVPSARPLRALLGKELRFQQINFLIAGGLLALQLVALIVQRFANTAAGHSLLDVVVDLFWAIWIIMPALVGGSAVAEERRFGTLEAQLCLPVSWNWQFALKVLVTMGCGVLLGAAVPVALALIHAGSGSFILAWIIGCAIVALMAFYASSLTQQLLQAFGVSIGLCVVGFVLAYWLAGSFSPGNRFALFGYELWRGPVVLIVGAGVTVIAAVTLCWRRWRRACLVMLGLSSLVFLNFFTTHSSSSGFWGAFVFCLTFLVLALALRNLNHLRPTASLWRRNAFIWLGCLLATGILTPSVYHRVWELFMRVEPPAHAARLSGDTRPDIIGLYYGRPLLVLLPDGRLSCIRESAIEKPGRDFIGGSNWVQVVSTLSEVVGIKSDGTLWSAPWYELVDATGKVRPSTTGVDAQKGERKREVELRFERVGEENDWKAISTSWGYCIALKQNGTIWGWGDNRYGQLGDEPKVFTNGPVRIGAQADWVAVCAGLSVSIAVNQAGEVWRWGRSDGSYAGSLRKSGPARLNFKVSEVRTTEWNGFDVILDTNGLLWGLGFVPPYWGGGNVRVPENFTTPVRLLGENWTAFSVGWDQLAAIKEDGSLWRLPMSRDDGSIASRPTRLGHRKDWIAVYQEQSSLFALARDGTLCRFGRPRSDWRRELLAPTRRVTWSVNVLDAAR